MATRRAFFFFFLAKQQQQQAVRLLIDREQCRRLERRMHCTQASAAAAAVDQEVRLDKQRASKRKKPPPPQVELRFALDTCSKVGDVSGALALYDKTRAEGVLKLDQYCYNVLLYLCSSAALGVLSRGRSSRQGVERKNGSPESSESVEELAVEDEGLVFRGNMAALIRSNSSGVSEEIMNMARERGLEIYRQMQEEGVPASEPTFTALARLAVAKRDGDLAFSITKQIASANISPKLRSYGPALYTYFKNNEVDKALEVDKHMLAHGVQPEEMELEVLLELTKRAAMADKVYSILHRIRSCVRGVTTSTVRTIESWFRSKVASEVTGKVFSTKKLVSACKSRGGGWHGLGWLGKGKWNVAYSELDEFGTCLKCKEKMALIDIDPKETERFADLVESLTYRKERNQKAFSSFQTWLERYGPFDVVIDGANVAIHQGYFSFVKLNDVVDLVKAKKWKFLVILHHKRTEDAAASTPFAKGFLKRLRESQALYPTPTDSNDDWYWLYAAVKCKCLLISNDEMRDHIFQLLGNDFFPKWKERHQVRFTKGSRTELRMPPPYSIVIQESENGSWHIPQRVEDEIATPRQWLCATRPATD